VLGEGATERKAALAPQCQLLRDSSCGNLLSLELFPGEGHVIPFLMQVQGVASALVIKLDKV
jgi:hypothetical protein